MHRPRWRIRWPCGADGDRGCSGRAWAECVTVDTREQDTSRIGACWRMGIGRIAYFLLTRMRSGYILLVVPVSRRWPNEEDAMDAAKVVLVRPEALEAAAMLCSSDKY